MKAGKGYRLLKIGEVILKGDELVCFFHGVWEKSSWIGRRISKESPPYRRKITAPRTKKETTHSKPCPVAKRVSQKIMERSRIGTAKYGHNMTRTDLHPLAWLKHLQEELLDGAVYVERIIGDIEEAANT